MRVILPVSSIHGMRDRPSFLLLTFALGMAALLTAGRVTADPQFTAKVAAVELYVSVLDRRGAVVPGLTRDDFEVREDGAPQEIGTFVAGDFPLSLAIGIDRSFSMKRSGLAAARAGARAAVDALRPVDEAMILTIGSETTIDAPLSTDRAAQRAAIDRLEVWGSTRLFDAVVLALDTIASARGRRALVLLTDGDERDSLTTSAQVLAKARQTGVLVYPVILAKVLPDIFRWLAAVTGARAFTPPPRELAAAVRTIVVELRHQYLIGYSPRRPLTDAPGRWRRVAVSTRRGDLQVRTREGYYP